MNGIIRRKGKCPFVNSKCTEATPHAAKGSARASPKPSLHLSKSQAEKRGQGLISPGPLIPSNPRDEARLGPAAPQRGEAGRPRAGGALPGLGAQLPSAAREAWGSAGAQGAPKRGVSSALLTGRWARRDAEQQPRPPGAAATQAASPTPGGTGAPGMAGGAGAPCTETHTLFVRNTG